jgi:hypothetical protein
MGEGQFSQALGFRPGACDFTQRIGGLAPGDKMI